MESAISKGKETLESAPKITEAPDFLAIMPLLKAEYEYSMHVRGDNTPEYAKYLGYLDAGELYPEFKHIPCNSFLEDLLAGKTEKPYPDGLENVRMK